MVTIKPVQRKLLRTNMLKLPGALATLVILNYIRISTGKKHEKHKCTAAPMDNPRDVKQPPKPETSPGKQKAGIYTLPKVDSIYTYSKVDWPCNHRKNGLSEQGCIESLSQVRVETTRPNGSKWLLKSHSCLCHYLCSNSILPVSVLQNVPSFWVSCFKNNYPHFQTNQLGPSRLKPSD